MLNTIKEFFKDITRFERCKNAQTEIDRYISSKYPQTVADVEYWTQEYNRCGQLRGIIR
jgi:hypothetical protein